MPETARLGRRVLLSSALRGDHIPMKCITLLQPWASLILAGQKHYETRSWQTSHRGTLLIHSGKKLTPGIKKLCQEYPFRAKLGAMGYDTAKDMPLGVILGKVTLVDCVPADTVLLTELERLF